MPGHVTTTEAQGQPTVSPLTDYAAVVIGYTPSSPLPANRVSALYSRMDRLAADYGLSDAVDLGCQAILKTNGNPKPPPISLCPTPATTPGAMAATDASGVTGTAVITSTSGATPKGTYQITGKVIDDGNSGAGGTVGVAGIKIAYKLGAGDVAYLPARDLGTATVQSVLTGDGVDTGASFTFSPSTTNAAYVTLAVELHGDVLAHLANVVAHDAADTSAAQIALAASSVPATVAASTAVVNLVLAALVSHVTNLTAHDGPDLVARNALALLSAATDAKTGIDLAIALKGIVNAHLAVALAAAGAGLMGSTASIASPQTYTAAGNFIAGGVAAMDAQPRRPEFVISGSGTPADMADSVTITGFDYAGAAQTETGLSLTGLGTVIATKAFKGTGLSCAFVTADGTGATFTIGYSKGGHNSADSTNTITSDAPTYGTLKTGDTWVVLTTPPTFAAADLYTAGSPATGAFAVIGQSSSSFGLVVISEPIGAAEWTALIAGLDYGAELGKDWTVLCRFRDPTSGETDAAYVAAFRTFAAAHSDSRVCIVVGSGWLTDAFRGYRYLRSGLPAVLARLAGNSVIPGREGERLAQHPGYVARGPLERFSIVDDAGNLVGHDEEQLAGIDGPIGAVGGGVTFFQIPSGGDNPGTFVSEADVLYPALSKVLTLMDRRLMNGIKRVARAILWTEIQGADIVDPDTHILDEHIADAIGGKVTDAVCEPHKHEFQNSTDKNLTKIDPEVTTTGSKDTITGTCKFRPFNYTHDIDVTFDASRG